MEEEASEAHPVVRAVQEMLETAKVLVAGWFGSEHLLSSLYVTVRPSVSNIIRYSVSIEKVGISQATVEESLWSRGESRGPGDKPRRVRRSFKYPGLGPRGASTIVYWHVRSEV